MKLIRGIYNFKRNSLGCVLTIGNFDGVHRGHQKLLMRLSQEGCRRKLPVVLMLFEPQPLEFFAGTSAPARLTSYREKLKYLKKFGVQVVLCVNFNSRFAGFSAKNFIVNVLVEKIGVKFLVVGDDFHFGFDRRGNISLLKKAGLKYGFEVINTKSFCDFGVRISSTEIRKALARNNFWLAGILLGRPFSISGRVVYGNSLGCVIGFPTANLLMRRVVLPLKGVYAVEVYNIKSFPLFGVANIGTRPTFKGSVQQLEVHLLDININLYGRYIDVVIKYKIRHEKRFFSLEALKKQIERDVMLVRGLF